MQEFIVVLLMIGVAGAQTGVTTPTYSTINTGQTLTCPSQDSRCTKPAPKPVARKKAVPDVKKSAACMVSDDKSAFGWHVESCEPLDVPAIQKTRKDEPNCSRSYIAGSSDDGWYMGKMNGMAVCGNVQTSTTRWTCADTSRILEHDESTPPKYWCRKPQP